MKNIINILLNSICLFLVILSVNSLAFCEQFHSPKISEDEAKRIAMSNVPQITNLVNSNFRISSQGPDGDLSYTVGRSAAAYDLFNSEYLVVWSGSATPGELEIFAQTVNADTGELAGSVVQVSFMGPNGDADYDAYIPAVAYNWVTNRFLVAWVGDDNTAPYVNDEFDVFVQQIDASTGALYGSPQRISRMGNDGSTSYIVSNTGVVGLAFNDIDNQYLVVWAATDNTGSLVSNEWEIYGQLLDANIAEIGTDDFRISDAGPDGDTTYLAGFPRVAWNPFSNRYLVVWTGTDNALPSTADDIEIYGQLLSNSGAEVENNDFRISDAGNNGATERKSLYADVAANSYNGQFLIVWTSDDDATGLSDDEYEVFGEFYTSEGASTGTNDFQISQMGTNGNSSYSAMFSTVAFNYESKNFYVAWMGIEDSVAPNEYEIWGRTVKDIYGDLGNQERISSVGTTGSLSYIPAYPALAFDMANARFLATWWGNNNLAGMDVGEYETWGQLVAPYISEVSITNVSSSSSVTAGETISFDITLSNSGPTESVVTRIYFIFPSDTSLFSYNALGWTCSYDSFYFECILDSCLSSGITLPSITVTLSTSSSASGDYSVTFMGLTGSYDPNMTNNYSIANFSVDGDYDGDTIPDSLDSDDDNDGLPDTDEPIFGTNPRDSDTDDDSVSDLQEILDGSNPLDRGSNIQVLETTLCSEWNGFLGGMYNIAEHVNMGSSDINVQTTLYDINGATHGQETFPISPGRQFDTLVHDMDGWTLNTYGKVCSTFTGGVAGNLDGRMVYYKESPTSTLANPNFEFVFAMPFVNGIKGAQYVPFNTYQPSFDSSDASNLVTNWIQITNLESTAQDGTLVFYLDDGSELGRQTVNLNAGARQDYSGHQFGVNKVGIVAWQPVSNNARFQLRNVRYFYDNPGTSDTFETAFQLEGMVGSGENLVVPLDTSIGMAVLEIANVTSSSQDVTVYVYNESGTEVHTETLNISGYGTRHIIADSILNGGKGIAIINGADTSGVTAVAMEYKRTSTNAVDYLYGIPARQALGYILRGSYNTFLGQGCRLLLANPTSSDVNVTVNMTRYDGTTALTGSVITVPDHGLVDYDLCANDRADVYGVVNVLPATDNSIVANVLRTGNGETYRFPTPVRQ